jgi:hypothetical protein
MKNKQGVLMKIKAATTNSAIWRRIAFIAVFTCAAASLSAITFTSIDELGKWLSAQPANTKDAPFTITLNVGDLGGAAYTPGSVGYVLKANDKKFVSLDLSGSTITIIPEFAFCSKDRPIYFGCNTLTGITIPKSVTSTRKKALNTTHLNKIMPQNADFVKYFI